MKTILALTDFSDSSRSAVECALAVARTLSADLLLVNVYSYVNVPTGEEGNVSTTGKLPDGRLDSMKRLNAEVRRLVKSITYKTPSGHHTIIRPIPLSGSLDEHVWKLARRKNSILIVLGSSGEIGHGPSKELTEALVGHAKRPVLIVPSTWHVKAIRHILVATDLAEEDQHLIKQLANIFHSVPVRISICHVHRPVFIADFAEEIQVAQFMDGVQDLHPNVRFYPAAGTNILAAVENTSGDHHADAIAMRHRGHPCFHYFFHQNPIKEALEHGHLPLLVFPDKRVNDEK